jgi:hypothetical protein
LFVTVPWEVVPVHQRYGMGALGWGLVIMSSILLIVGIIWWRHEVKDGGRRIRGQVVAVRANRHRLAEGRAQAGPVVAPAAPASSPAGPEQQAPPPP